MAVRLSCMNKRVSSSAVCGEDEEVIELKAEMDKVIDQILNTPVCHYHLT